MPQLKFSLYGCLADMGRTWRLGARRIVCAQPKQHVTPAPTDSPPMKPLLPGEASEKRQRLKDPSSAARESRHVMGSQKLLTGRKAFIHPSRERHARGGSPIGDFGCELVDGHGEHCSCVVPAVRRRVVTHA